MSKVNISAAWDRSTEFLGDNITAVTAIALPSIYLPQLVQVALQPLAEDATYGLMVRLVALVMIVVGLWGQLQIAALALDPARSVAQARKTATAAMPRAIAVSLCLMLLVFVFALPVIGVLVAAGVDFAALARAGETGNSVPVPTGLTPGVMLFVLLYTLGFLVVALWGGARLIVLNAVILAERRWFGAIARSFEMSRGHTFVLIGLLVLYGIVSFVAVLAAQTVFGSLFGLVAGGDGPLTIATVLTAVVVAGVTTAFALLITSFVVHFYRAVRAHENADAA